MTSTVQPTLPPVALAAIKEALGCMFMGVVLAMGVYGISVLQAYIYFRDSSHDGKRMKLFVAFLFLLDTISLALTISAEWQNFVSDFGNPVLPLTVPTAISVGNAFAVVIGTLTQCFFANQLWALSKRNRELVGCIVILALCSCGPGMALSVRLYQDKSIMFFGSLEVRILSAFWLGISVLCDVLIAAALSYYLRSKKTGFKRTDSMITRLIIYAINRGALTAICLAGEMITTVAFPGRFVFVPFGFVSARLYCNTLLATLNAQRTLSREPASTAVELGSQIFRPMNTSLASRNGGSHRGHGESCENVGISHRSLKSSVLTVTISQTSGYMPSFAVKIDVEKTTEISPAPSSDTSRA